MTNSFTIFLIVLKVAPAFFDRFNVLIIPIRGVQPEKGEDEDTFRLDMENYGKPTPLPDIDNYNFARKNNEDSTIEDLKGKYDNYEEDKIVNGVEVNINMYPYHVAYGAGCGGAIIHEKWVVTAAHCGKKSYIRVGSKYMYQGKKIPVKSNHIHPNWLANEKGHQYDYDFQVLELAEALRFNDNVQPIKVGHVEDMVVGKIVTVTGWGRTGENGRFSNTLRAVRIPIVTKEKCQRVPFPYYRGSLTPRMFCAGYPEGKKDACQGDSGGPAAADGVLLGIVSFGYGCATPGSYGVYSKVASVRNWIQEVTKLDLD